MDTEEFLVYPCRGDSYRVGLFFTAILSKPRVRRERIRDGKAGASESRREPSDGVDVSSEEKLVERSGIKGLSWGCEPSDMESSLNKGECRPAEF